MADQRRKRSPVGRLDGRERLDVFRMVYGCCMPGKKGRHADRGENPTPPAPLPEAQRGERQTSYSPSGLRGGGTKRGADTAAQSARVERSSSAKGSMRVGTRKD